MLAVGTICSLSAMAIRVMAPPVTMVDPSNQASALPGEPSDSIDTVAPSVTEMSPVSVQTAVIPGSIVDTAGIAVADDSTPPEAAPSARLTLHSEASVPALAPWALLEADLLDRMNGARFEHGLAGLERYDYLDEVALARAESLVAHGYFDHTAPDGSSAFSVLADRGILYRLAGENLARNNYPEGTTVEAAFQGLMASPGHRQNILEPAFGAIGLAVVQSGGMWYHVMVFTNPR